MRIPERLKRPSKVPIKFAIYLLNKFAPNEYDRPENKPRVLLDGKALPEKKETPSDTELEAKKLEEITTIKLLLDNNGVEYPEDASISKLRKMRTTLNKKLRKDAPPK